MSEPVVGERCTANGLQGTVRFYGATSFAPGLWTGVELDDAQGKNDGSINAVHYFHCAPNHGIFVRASKISAPQPTSDPLLVTPTSRKPTRAVRTAIHNSGSSQAEPVQTPPRHSRSVSRSSVASGEATVVSGPGLRAQLDRRMTTSASLPSATTRNRNALNSNEGQQSSETRTRRTMSKFAPNTPKQLRAGSFEVSTKLEPAAQLVTRNAPADLDTPSASGNESAEISKERSIIDEHQSVTTQITQFQSRVKKLEEQRVEDVRRLSILSALEGEKSAWILIRTKLREKLQMQQAEIRELQGRVKSLEARLKERLDSVNSETDAQINIQEALEMATLDREVAEEERDQSRLEIDRLRSQIEEFSTELKFLKTAESEITKPDSESSYHKFSETQEARLKDALIRLKEITHEQDKELVTANKEIDSLKTELELANATLELVKSQLSDMELLVEDLKGQVDMSLGAEEMLEAITSRNLDLGEQLENCRAEISDLETLRSVNEELEESLVQSQREIQQELLCKEETLRLQQERIETDEHKIAQYTETIGNYKEVILRLQQEIDSLRNDTARIVELKSVTDQHNQVLLTQNVSLKSADRNESLQKLRLELKSQEAVQAIQHLEILKEYLPITYVGDVKRIAVYLLCEHISGISQVLAKFYESQIPEISMEDFTRVTSNMYRLVETSLISREIASNIAYTDMDLAETCEELLPILQPLELSILDTARSIELDRMSETMFVTQLDHIMKSLEAARVKSMAIDNAWPPSIQVWSLCLNINLSSTVLQRLHEVLKLHGEINEIDLAAIETAASDLQHCKSSADKLNEKEKDHLREGSCFSSKVSTEYFSTIGLCRTVFTTLREFHDSVRSLEQDWGMFDPASVNQPFAWEDVGSSIKKLRRSCDTLANLDEDSSVIQRASTRWSERGAFLRSQEQAIETDQAQVLVLRQEIQTLLGQLHKTEKELEEEKLKCQSFRKRAREHTDEAEKCRTLEAEQQRMTTEKALQVQALDEMNRQMKVLQEQLKKSVVDSPPSTKTPTLSTEVAEKEILLLKKTIKHLQTQITTLRVSPELGDTGFLSKPLLPYRRRLTHSNEVNVFFRAVQEFNQTMSLVNFQTTPLADTTWKRNQDKCAYLHYAQEEKYARLFLHTWTS